MSMWHNNPSNPDLNAVYVDDVTSEISLHPSISFASDGKYILPPFKNPRKVTNTSTAVQINLVASKRVYTTNETISGSLVVTCQKPTSIASISVYLVGFEQGIVTKQKVFLMKEFKIQGVDSPPNPATMGKSDAEGCQEARLGTHQIPFAFSQTEQNPLLTTLITSSDPLPSSFSHAKAGGVKYALIGVLDHKLSRRRTLACHLPLTMIEAVPYRLLSTWSNLTSATERFRKDNEIQINGFMGFGKKGVVKMNTTLLTLRTDGILEPGLWLSGSKGYVSIKIDNQSPATITSASLELVRTLRVFKVDKETGEFRTHSFSKMCVSKSSLSQAKHPVLHSLFNFAEEDPTVEEWAGISPFSEQLFQSTIQIPPEAKTIRNTSLIDVSYTLIVTVAGTKGYYRLLDRRKPLVTETDILILDSASVLSPPPLDNTQPPKEEISNTVNPEDIDEIQVLKTIEPTVSSTTLIEPRLSVSRSRTTLAKPKPLSSFTFRKMGSVKRMTLNLPPAPTTAPPSVVEREGAKVIPTLADWTDLDMEIDRISSDKIVL